MPGLSSLRALNYGRKFGDYNRDANFAPSGAPLGPRDVALSPNQMRRYPIGSNINATTAGGQNLGTYTVADPSYRRPGVPTSNTIEFRNRALSGQSVNIGAADNPFGLISGGIDVFGDYPTPPRLQNYGSGVSAPYQQGQIPGGIDIGGPSLPGQFQQAFQQGSVNSFTDPTAPLAGATPVPSLTPFDPMGYGAGANIPPNEDVTPNLSTNLQYSGSGNIPPNEDISPTPINTFLGSQNTNATGTAPRRYPIPGLGGIASANWATNAVNNPVYPVPGVGGLPSTYGGGQSWQSNAARSGGGGIAGGSGYGSGRFAGPSVSFGYGGTQIGPTSGSLFYGQAVQHF